MVKSGHSGIVVSCNLDWDCTFVVPHYVPVSITKSSRRKPVSKTAIFRPSESEKSAGTRGQVVADVGPQRRLGGLDACGSRGNIGPENDRFALRFRRPLNCQWYATRYATCVKFGRWCKIWTTSSCPSGKHAERNLLKRRVLSSATPRRPTITALAYGTEGRETLKHSVRSF